MLATLAPRNPWTRPERREFVWELNSTVGNIGDAPVRIGRRDDRFDPLSEEINVPAKPNSQRPERPAQTGKKREREFDSRVRKL